MSQSRIAPQKVRHLLRYDMVNGGGVVGQSRDPPAFCPGFHADPAEITLPALPLEQEEKQTPLKLVGHASGPGSRGLRCGFADRGVFPRYQPVSGGFALPAGITLRDGLRVGTD